MAVVVVEERKRMLTLNIGVIGFGTVGAGVVETVFKNSELMAQRTGVRPVIARIADLDTTTDRGIALPDGLLVPDAMALIEDPAIDVIVELVGGTGVAKKFVVSALEHGKHVVTANKALLAKCGKELFDVAKANGVEIYFEASVGGGIPCIKALREGLVANSIQAIYGILNGTCNYILTRMSNEKANFADVLTSAQKAGYAEADPSADVDGWDTANKAVILASLAFGRWFSLDDLSVRGIREVTLADIENAEEAGYKIKLLAIIRNLDGQIQLSVQPTLISANSLLGHVNGVFNAVMVSGDIVGSTMYDGRGAGRAATSSAVVADLVDIGLNKKAGSLHRLPAFPEYGADVTVAPRCRLVSRYYLRLNVLDRPGVLSTVSGILAAHGISIASVKQCERKPGDCSVVPMMIITHQASAEAMDEAAAEIEQLDTVAEKPVVFQIADPME